MSNDAGVVGRKVVLEWDNTLLSGVREKGIKLDGSAIDVTSDENDGWQELLTEAGENKMEISLSGVLKSDKLKNDWNAGNRTKIVTLTYPNGGEFAGTFFLANYSEKGTYKDGVTFEATLMSSGKPVWTPYA